MKDSESVLTYFPNSMAPVIVQGTLAIAPAIIEAAESRLSGVRAQNLQPEWGKDACRCKNLFNQCTMDNDFPWSCNYANCSWI